MSYFNSGDIVRRTSGSYGGMVQDDMDTVVEYVLRTPGRRSGLSLTKYGDGHDVGNFELVSKAPIGDPDDSKLEATDITPAYYAFPGGVRVHQISGHLTSFGGQAVQYIARSTRLDGENKGDTAENLRKAIRFLNLEIERIEAAA